MPDEMMMVRFDESDHELSESCLSERRGGARVPARLPVSDAESDSESTAAPQAGAAATSS